MTHGPEESSNPFDVARQSEPREGRREPVRGRRLSLPLRMDNGQVKAFELPTALEHPSQFSTSEFERLTRAYAEALGLLDPRSKPEL
jgi:hypothetical protein